MTAKEIVRSCFNSRAHSYEPAADVQPIVARELSRRLRGDDVRSVLEIGCGTGLMSRYLVKTYPEARIVLTDISPSMCALSEQRFKERRNVTVECIDGELLPAHVSFDLIVSSMTLHWFSDVAGGLQKLLNRLNPGGTLLFAMMGSESMSLWKELCLRNCNARPTPDFPSTAHLRSLFPEMEIDVAPLAMRYRNTLSFLRTLKSIGAHASNPSHRPLSIQSLRRLMKSVDATSNGGGDIEITYEIIYGQYRKV